MRGAHVEHGRLPLNLKTMSFFFFRWLNSCVINYYCLKTLPDDPVRRLVRASEELTSTVMRMAQPIYASSNSPAQIDTGSNSPTPAPPHPKEKSVPCGVSRLLGSDEWTALTPLDLVGFSAHKKLILRRGPSPVVQRVTDSLLLGRKSVMD